jgi:hypothetical protein
MEHSSAKYQWSPCSHPWTGRCADKVLFSSTLFAGNAPLSNSYCVLPSEAKPHKCMIVWLVMANSVYFCDVQQQRNIQAVAVHVWWLSHSQSAVCTHTVVTMSDLQDLLFQIPALMQLLRDFCTWRHFWGTVDEGWRNISQRHWYPDLTLYCWTQMSPHIHLLPLVSSFVLTLPYVCSPAISMHLVWRLLSDICFPVCIYNQLPPQEQHKQTGLWNRLTGSSSNTVCQNQEYNFPQNTFYGG